MASTQRNTIKYQFRVGNKIIHRGISIQVDRGELESTGTARLSCNSRGPREVVVIEHVTGIKRAHRK